MKKLLTSLLIIFFYLNPNLTNVYALAVKVKDKNMIQITDQYAHDNGSAFYSYDPAKIKGIGIEIILGKLVSSNFSNMSPDIMAILIFKNGEFQDVSYSVQYSKGLFAGDGFHYINGNGGGIMSEVNIRTTCPTECAKQNRQWNDQTTRDGAKGSCVCEPIPEGKQITCNTSDVEGQPIVNNEVAPTICPTTCDTAHGKWNGQWNGYVCGCVVCKF